MRFLLISALFLSAVYLSQSRAITYDATTDELKNQVDNLKKQAQDAIQKLMAQGKIALAGGIKNLETHLIDLESQLEKLNPQTEVGKALLKSLEALVKGAETKLEEEIKKLSGAFYADDIVRAALMKDVSDLYDQVKAGIEELAKTGKTELVNGLEKVIKFVESLKAKVMTLKPTTDLGKAILNLVEQLAAKGEDILKADLKKAQGTFYAEDPDKEALLALAGKIYDDGKAAYEKLAKEDKKVVINALTKTVTLIKEAETDLMSLHPTTTIGKTILTGVEKLVKQIETVIDMDLKALEKGAFYDATTDELKKQVENLKNQAQAEIKKLEAQGKSVLAVGIKKLEDHLVDLESQLEKLNPQTEVGKALQKSLETLIKGAEIKLEEEIKKLSGNFYADDPTRAALMKDVADLYDQVKAGVEELAKTGKTELVNGLEKAIKFIESLYAKMVTLKPTTELGKLVLSLVEDLAKRGEAILQADLKKAQSTFYADAEDPDRVAFLFLAGKIFDEGKAAYEKLAKEDKKALISGLTKTIALIKEAETDLMTLQPTTTIGKTILAGVEKLVKHIETLLDADLKALGGGFYDATTDELKKQVENLKNQAQAEIKKLEAQGKSVLAVGIKKLEDHLVDLESQLEKLNPQTEVGKALQKSLEALIKGAETKLEEEIKKLSGGFYVDDPVKPLVMKEVTDLYDQVASGIEELAKTSKTELVNGLEKVIKFLESVSSKLTTLKPTTDVGKAVLQLVEQLAAKGEEFLKADLKKAQGAFYAEDASRMAFLALAEKIYDQGKAAYDKLAKEDKKVAIDGLTKTIAFIEEIKTEMMTLHPTTTIGKNILTRVEAMVNVIESISKVDLAALQKGF